MGRIGGLHARQRSNGHKRIAVQRNTAERGREGIDRRNGDPPERDVMRRPDQDDTLDAFCAVFQGGERCRGYLAGIAVARMGSDNRLRAAARGRSGSRGQKLADFGAKAIRVGRVELTRYGGRPGREVVSSRLHGIAHLG